MLTIDLLAPMLWGPVSDHIGRRPISALCLLILTLSCVGLALTPTSDYWLLMVLRCLQATGSASTIAIGDGDANGIRILMSELYICLFRCRCNWRYLNPSGKRWLYRSIQHWSYGEHRVPRFNTTTVMLLMSMVLSDWPIRGPCDWRSTCRSTGLEVCQI